MARLIPHNGMQEYLMFYHHTLSIADISNILHTDALDAYYLRNSQDILYFSANMEQQEEDLNLFASILLHEERKDLKRICIYGPALIVSLHEKVPLEQQIEAMFGYQCESSFLAEMQQYILSGGQAAAVHLTMSATQRRIEQLYQALQQKLESIYPHKGLN